MNSTYCITFQKLFDDGRPAEKSYTIERAASSAEAMKQFKFRALTPISDFNCDRISHPRLWVEAE